MRYYETKESIQTSSILIQSLCVPCFNRCRYCLLSWNGKIEGADWERSITLAKRYINELKEYRPQIRSSFAFGYSMEHPHLKDAIRILRRLGSPMADFLQCDGMKMRDEVQCRNLMRMLQDEGIKQLNFTVYGLADYHDQFAARNGDYDLLIRMMKAADECGIPFSTGIPLTRENINEIDELVSILKRVGSEKISLFIPHEEGHGKQLSKVRLREQDLSIFSPKTLKLLNRDIYRKEADWLKETEPIRDENRLIIISLRMDNIEEYETKNARSVIKEIETLDEEYYSAFPKFEELAKEYGDFEGEKMYRVRDLYHHYRSLYAADHKMQIYDVTDERQSGSRRY